MARFFQTAPTQFVEDFIYQPPWQLIQSIGARKQQEYNNALTEVNLLRDLPIQYINTEANKQTADNIKQSINKEVDDITSLIKSDGLNVNSYRPRIEKLTRDLKNNVTSGDIFKLATDYNNLQNNIKQNEERMKKDPARYTAGMNSFMKKFLDAGGDSLKTGYKGELITEDIDWNKVYDAAEKIKASEYVEEKVGASNGYILKNKKTGKEVTQEELMTNILSRVLTSDNISSLQQSERIGIGKYFKEDGFTPDITYDSKGKIIGSAQGWIPSRLFANSAAYSENKIESDMSSDGTYVAKMNEAGRNSRWAIDRQDKLNKEYQDRVDAANKTKDEKVSAIDKEIADGWINNDMVKVQFYENAKNNLLGREGTFKSNAGSMFKNFSDLQTKSASGNVDAQKQLSQGLNTFLKKSGIDFKDPRQKALAQDIVGKIKQNKLSLDDLDDYLDKMVPASYSNQLSISEKNRANKEYSEALKPLQDAVRVSEMKLSNTRKTLNELKKLPENSEDQKLYKNQQINKVQTLVSEWEKDLENKRKKVFSINKDSFSKSILESNKRNSKDYNEGFRNTFKSKIENALTNFKDDWETNKSKFTTNYATAPLSISGQSSMKTILRDVNNRKDFVNEDGTEVSATQFNNFDNITSIVPTDGRGRYGLIATDKNGNQTRLLTNPGTPIYNAVYNIAKADVNSNTEVGLAVKYPTIGIIKQRAEALKTAGQSNVRLDIKSAKGNEYHIQQVGNTDRFIVIDRFGKDQTNGSPVNYVEAGRMIDGLDK